MLPCISCGGYRAGCIPGGSFSSHGIRRVLFMLPLLLATIGVDGGFAQSAPSATLTISEVRQDADDDGFPDRMGDRVAVDGVVTIGSQDTPGESLDVFVQDGTGGIWLKGVPADMRLQEGENVMAVGTVRLQSGQSSLEIESIQMNGAESLAVAPRAISYSTLDLQPFTGLLVRTDGYIIEKAQDDHGIYLLLDRRGETVLVRFTNDAVFLETAWSSYQVGEFYKVTGVLLPTGNQRASGVSHKVLSRRLEDVQKGLIPPHLYIWLIPLGLLLLGFGVSLVFRLKRKSASQVTQKYQSVFDTAPAAIVITDPEFRIQDANAATLRLLDTSHRHLRRKHLFEIVESVSGFDSRAIARRLQSHGSMAIEARYTREDHRVLELEVLLRSTTIANETRIVSCIQDVTQGRKSLGLYEAFLQQLMDALPIEVIVYSSDGKYRFVNPAVSAEERMREWLIGKTDFEYCEQSGFHMEVALRRRTYRKQAVQEKRVVCFEESITAPSGETRHFLRMFSPQVNGKGKVTVVAGFGLETTDLKQALEDGADARREAEKMMRIKEAFLQNVSHEFRTPLTGIVGFAQILQDEVPEPMREFVENIESNGRRLMTTLNSMLDMAGLQGENVDLDPAVVNIVREVDIAVRGLETKAQEKKLFLRMQPTSTEILVCLDQPSLQRILQSLVGNAIKFTESGGVVVEISEVDEHAVIRVVDSGVGIEQQFMPEIFEAFNQEESGVNRSFEGVGLGLAVTKTLVRLLGGSVTVQSEKGEGSMFTIKFPLALSKTAGVFKDKVSVLVVDQNAETRRIALHVLDHHFEVREASSVSEAMNLIDQGTFDTVLLDVNMEDGASEGTLLDRVRQQPGYDRVSIIAMQTDAAPGGQKKFRKLGFDDHLPKPFNRVALLNAIANKSAMSRSVEDGAF